MFSDQRTVAARWSRRKSVYVLGGESLVVHEQKVDISGIVNNESFVAGGHQISGFLVRTVSYLNHCASISLCIL